MTSGTLAEVPPEYVAGRADVRPATLPWRRRIARALPPYLYLAPALAGAGFWVYRPLAQTVELSFFNWDLLPTSPMVPAGLSNYTRLLHSPQLGSSLWVTAAFMLGMLPFTMVGPTVIGLLTRRVAGRLGAVYRGLVFAPVLVPPVAGAVVWQWLMDPTHGAIDRAIGAPVNWLEQPGPAQVAIIVITGWHVLGFAVLIVSAGLAGINDDYTAAAQLDGASRGQITRWVTLPLLSPTLSLLALMTVLLSAQWSFPVIDTLTQGGPAGATTNIYYLLWQQAFQGFAAGTAAAAGVMFFLGFGVVAVFLAKLTERFSFYDD